MPGSLSGCVRGPPPPIPWSGSHCPSQRSAGRPPTSLASSSPRSERPTRARAR
ncbi:hypothetical protein SEA_POPPER_31 [Arthrobacter phage Popper]|uniref:Uncharacterized protein n=1 Tax=Arthrobacter phage Popper TaxID=2859633 RepID=A0AAE7WDA1_9CAUD|nr:hypothetical protein QEO78_gp31 [Arthrobacter phage Popper]QYC54950.1 hypothetical protein SEA_POPPER_31 [Arthrobacter phage Popper]